MDTEIKPHKNRCLRQFISSLPSLHSVLPEQWKWPAMHDLSAHWNWSARHVIFWQFGIISSSPPGQSISPSQIQLRWIQVMPSLHWYSACTHDDSRLTIVVQFYKRKFKCQKKKTDKIISYFAQLLTLWLFLW